MIRVIDILKEMSKRTFLFLKKRENVNICIFNRNYTAKTLDLSRVCGYSQVAEDDVSFHNRLIFPQCR